MATATQKTSSHHRSLAAAIIGCALLAAPAAVAEPDIDFDTDLSRDSVGPGEDVRYEAVVRVEGNFPIEMSERPELDDMTIRGRSSSPSFSVHDGTPSRSVTIQYQLQAPETPGTYRLGAPTFAVGDETVSGQSVTLEVVEDPGRPVQTDAERDRSDEPAFVGVSIAPDRPPYVGEQIGVEFDLYIREDQRQLRARPPGEPALDDFWVVDTRDDMSRRRSRTRRDGHFWYVTPLDASALFPFRAGPTTIDGIEVPLARASLFGRGDGTVVTSDPVDLEIQPLPDGAPEGFSAGNVGDFDFSVDVDSKTARAGGDLTVRATVEGPVRSSRIGEPNAEFSDGFRHIASSDETSQSVVDGRLKATRTFEYRLMPVDDGTLQLPSLVFSYFDPDLGEYITRRSDPIDIEVEPGDVPGSIDDGAPVSQRGDSQTSREFRPLQHPGDIEGGERPSFPVPPWLVLLPLLGMIVLFLERPVIQPIVRRLSPKLRRRHLRKQFERLLGDTDQPPASRCLHGLQLILSEGLELQIGALTSTDVDAALTELDNMDPGLANDAAQLVDELTNRRYRPDSDADCEPLISQTRDLVGRLLDWHFDTAVHEVSSTTTTTAMLLAIGIGTAGVAAATPVAEVQATEFDEAPMAAGEDRDWATVADYWRQRADQAQDPIFDYNAGTAFAYAGDTGYARLHLERATAAGGDHDALHHNLAELTSTIAADHGSVAAFGPQQRWAQYIHTTAPWVATAILWALLVLAIVQRSTGRPRSRTGLVTAVGIGAITAAVAVGAWYEIDGFYDDPNLGVVIDGDQLLREAPSASASTAWDSSLPPGAMVRVQRDRSDWVRVELPCSITGWIEDDAVAAITP